MNVPQEDLNDWATRLHGATGPLLALTTYLHRQDAPLDAQGEVDAVRTAIVGVQKAIIRAGADDPSERNQAESRRRMRDAGYDDPEPEPLPLSLLASEKAKRYAEAIRAAAIARREMEEERYGPGCDGLAEVLEDYADSAEFETFGPVGLRE